ncbi:Hsp33 family molecular chaperone HslO [Roseospirillum parvum]|uniref:Molecular chaperone Hsp33 n=1 Tax=Roseospirillum parvum TaxID=83401 RepID=A0A1G7U5C3_9PROT|nr:Hsp33 family molecular chaperone HslO [Roseospirillum parvum]SDG42461.1 molecular chaperone Hsp33 [Roseospirillum parvum]
MSDAAAPLGQVIPFRIEGGAFRGRLIRADALLADILGRHAYPAAVNRLLGETILLGAGLASLLKFDGIFTLQTASQGAIRTLVTDVTSGGQVRACARFHAEALETRLASLDPERVAEAPVPHLMGPGHLAFTVDPSAAAQQRYQGLVELDGATLGDAVHAYFHQSEQLDSAVKLALAETAEGWRGGLILLQRMPEDGGRALVDAEDSWRTAVVLLSSLKDGELLDPELPAPILLNRLFHASGLMVETPRDLTFGCRCARERVDAVLASLAPEELASLTEDDGSAHVDCEYCGTRYTYTPAQLAALSKS